MKELFQQMDRTPVTLLVALAYVTLIVLCNPFDADRFGELLHRHGMLTPLAVAGGEPWRLLASAFLHGGIVHLLVNLSTLMALGPALELSLGSVRFAAVYVVAALGGSLAVCLCYDVQEAVVGGSGALFGMMGSLVALNMRAGRHLFSFLDFEGPRRLLGLIAVNLVLSWLIPFVSNTAHVGGLLAGFLVTFVWLVPGRERGGDLRAARFAFTALFASLLFASVMPVTRYDWLWNAGVAADPPARADALRRAAAMARFGIARAGPGEVENLRAILFPEPPADAGDPPPRRR